MGYRESQISISRISNADLTAKRYYLVKEVAGGIDVCGDGELPLGALDSKPEAAGASEDGED